MGEHDHTLKVKFSCLEISYIPQDQLCFRDNSSTVRIAHCSGHKGDKQGPVVVSVVTLQGKNLFLFQ